MKDKVTEESEKQISNETTNKEILIKKTKKENFLNKEATLEEVYDYKCNSFDIIRLVLALCVIISHSFELFGADRLSIVTTILRVESLGGLSVIAFFVISGFLITQSMINSKSYIEYFYKRILRIYPALIVALLLCAFVVAPLANNTGIGEIKNESIDYVIKNMNLFGRTSYAVANSFESNPCPGTINGSIWTIKHDIAAYILVAILSFFTLLKHRKIALSITIGLIAIYIMNPVINVSRFDYIGVFAEWAVFIKLMTYFMIGCLMYLYKDKIIISFKLFLFACSIFVLGIVFSKVTYSILIAFPYIVIYLSSIKIKFDLKKIGDFSYGLYIYAFPVQQLVTYYFRESLNIYTYIIVCISITMILAILSWYLIEKPFLKLKRINLNLRKKQTN